MKYLSKSDGEGHGISRRRALGIGLRSLVAGAFILTFGTGAPGQVADCNGNACETKGSNSCGTGESNDCTGKNVCSAPFSNSCDGGASNDCTGSSNACEGAANMCDGSNNDCSASGGNECNSDGYLTGNSCSGSSSNDCYTGIYQGNACSSDVGTLGGNSCSGSSSNSCLEEDGNFCGIGTWANECHKGTSNTSPGMPNGGAGVWR